jgi:hypothetical protein
MPRFWQTQVLSETRSSLAPMRVTFAVYWILIVGGIALYLTVGLTHH